MRLCVVCNKPVEAVLVKEEFPELFAQADAWGMDSLTEQEQVVVEFGCCSTRCFENIDKPACICVDYINGNPDPIPNPDCPIHGSLRH